ncbi:hypothetical protein AALP_AA8G510100 [Arabis alpina]|uniref:Uncharacterized protein n=1 Tax=Arabis alpina TaxID=50452 RepID=A0A087GEU8_ARAAL|nr:hypothetical protein AALP_AA8G510100 [Arabis alpina]
MLMKRLVSFLIDSDLIVEESLNCCRGSEIDRWVWSRPDVKVYTMLVNGLAASLRVSDSLKIIRDICRVGISPAEEVSKQEHHICTVVMFLSMVLSILLLRVGDQKDLVLLILQRKTMLYLRETPWMERDY